MLRSTGKNKDQKEQLFFTSKAKIMGQNHQARNRSNWSQ